MPRVGLRRSALASALLLALTTTAGAQSDSGTGAAGTPAGLGGSAAGTGDGGAAGSAGASSGQDTAESAGSGDVSTGSRRTGMRGWRTFGSNLPDLGEAGIETPRLIPGIRSSVTISDNVLHRTGGRSSAGVILEASPYLLARSEAPNAKYAVNYQMRNFVRLGSNSDINLLRHNLTGQGTFALAGDRLWLDVGAFMGSINASPSGTLSIDPSTSFSNTSRYRRFHVAPWYRDRLGDWAQYKLRYQLTRTDTSGGFSTAKWRHHASGELGGIDRGADWNWSWRGDYMLNDYGNDFTRERRYSQGVLSYRYSPALMLLAGIEYEMIEGVRNEDGDDYGYGPMVGVQWSPNSRLHLSTNIAERYYGTVGSARVTWSTARQTLGAIYSRTMMTGSDPSMLTLDPRALTANPYGRSDPFVDSLIGRGIVLPEGIPIARSWITDSAVLDNRLHAFWAYRMIGGALMLSAYKSDRESAATVDMRALGGIRGSGLASSSVFSGTLLERGITLSYTHFLGARSRVEASYDWRQVESPTAGFENQLNTLRLGAVGQITPMLNAFVGLRLTRQSAHGRGSEYDENAVYGGVDMRF